MMRPDDFFRIEAALRRARGARPVRRAPCALAAACPDRPDLRTEIEALLAAHDRSGTPTTASTPADAADRSAPARSWARSG